MKTTFCLLLVTALCLGVVNSQIIGQVEFASTELVRGWVCDLLLPSRTVTVTVQRDNGINIGSAQATVPRPDIAPRCNGKAATGFILRFSGANIAALSDNNPHTLRVQAQRAFFAGSTQVPGSPVIVSSAPLGLRGFLDVANSTAVAGWACDPSHPNRNIQVRIFVDDSIFAGNTIANFNREPAVGQQCGGNSQHGFRFNFPQNIVNILSNGQPHTVSAFAIPREGGEQSGNPIQLSASPKTVQVFSGPLRGFLDSANATFAAGWACDPLQPGQFLRVNFVLDGSTFAGSVLANQNREPAVGQQCGGNSQHGFTFHFPQNIINILNNGQSHSIAAFALPFPSGNPTELSNSPRTIQATTPSVPRGFLDVANVTFASGWACDPLRPTQSLTVNILIDGTISAGSVVANLNREAAVGQQCGGNSQHGWTIQFPPNIVSLLSNGQTHSVAAFAVPFPTGTPTQLSNSPLNVLAPIIRGGIPVGFLDVANATFAAGWGCDPTLPNQFITVNILIDGTTFAGSVTANLNREPAVGQQCGGNSQHGWTIQFSPNIVNLLSNGQPHTVAAFLVPVPTGTPVQASGSPKTVQVTLPSVPRGFLDAANNTFASGWACDPLRPTQSLTVNLFVDGTVFAGSAVANLNREPAVGQQCGGNSQHGWTIQFPQNIINILSNGQPHLVSAFAVPFPSGTPAQLSNSPITVVTVVRGGPPVGFLDVANATFAAGWACDPTLPNQFITVNIIVDGTIFAGSVTANLNREFAVGQQCGGNSQHGWTFNFPPNIVNILSNGQSHTVAAFMVPFPTGTAVQASGSPKTVQVILPSVPRGFLDAANATFASGWACDPLRPTQSLTVNLFVDGTVFAGSAVANLNREPAVGQQCGGNSQHGWTIQFPQNIINILSNGQPHTVSAFALPFPSGTPAQLSNSPITVITQRVFGIPRGFLDAASVNSASGWACDPLNPSDPLTVTFLIDGTINAGSVSAGNLREAAVGQQCGGNSAHGFSFNFPQNIINILNDGNTHSVAAFTTSGPNQIQLSQSPRTVQGTAPVVPPRGFLDVASTTRAAGWACDPTNFNQPLTIVFVIDGSISGGQTIANLPRESAVGDQCGGFSSRGFDFAWPANIQQILQSGSHTVSAFALDVPSGNQQQLSNSPQTVTGF